MIGKVDIGVKAGFNLQIRQLDGTTASTAFLGTDDLAAELWTGDDQAVISTPTMAWTDATTASYRLTFEPADTSGQIPGTYRVRGTATRSGVTYTILRDTIELVAVPGSGTAPKVYCSYQDLTKECSWIGQIINTDEDQTGFAEQRAAARDWLDSLILQSQPVTGGLNLISRQNSWSWNSPGGNEYVGNNLAHDTVMAGYLADDKLLLTTPYGKQAVRACACYALGLIFRNQAGPGTEMSRFASYYTKMASNLVSSLIAELDTNDDGVAEYAIALSITNTRYA